MVAACQHQDGESVKIITTREIQEKLDGKDAAVTAVEVTIGPGQSGQSHRHPGPGFVYVVEGEYELGLDDQPTKVFHAGEIFYEPTGRLHRVSKNPAAKGMTRLIAFVLHPRDAKMVAIPEQTKP
jgi:quercetin dioxygenase-like cupin family protein